MRFLLTILLLSAALASFAQTGETQAAAFSASYNAEASKDYDKAIASLKTVYSPASYEVNLRLGWLYYQKKDYNQSLNYYKVAVGLKPSSIEALFGFINPAAALSNWAEVFGAYKKILALDEKNSVANYRIAQMYYLRKEYVQAETQLNKVINLYPFDYDMTLLMAQIKLGLGKKAESKSYYQRVLLYNPSNTAVQEILKKM